MNPEALSNLAVLADPDVPPLRAQAEALSARLGLPLASTAAGQHELLLVVTLDLPQRSARSRAAEPHDEPWRTATRLELREPGPRAAGPVFVDFSAARFQRRRKGGLSRELLARAVGFKGEPLHVVDATAGLGGDAFLLASVGCRVTAIERSPVLAALLEDGLRRASADPTLAPIVQERIRLISGDARIILPRLDKGPNGTNRPDVTYIDPMFPGKPRGRLSRKEMRLCRLVAGGDVDAADLLEAALAVTRRRVVVKRSNRAPALGRPDFSYRGTTIRYDAYVPETGIES